MVPPLSASSTFRLDSSDRGEAGMDSILKIEKRGKKDELPPSYVVDKGAFDPFGGMGKVIPFFFQGRRRCDRGITAPLFFRQRPFLFFRPPTLIQS